MNRSLSRWVNMELTSWGSLLNEVFNPHHWGEQGTSPDGSKSGKDMQREETRVWPQLVSDLAKAPTLL